MTGLTVRRGRRSRRDMQLGRFLAVGQRWRSRDDGSVWIVRQVHRQDCRVDLVWAVAPGGNVRARISLRFDVLASDFKWIAPA